MIQALLIKMVCIDEINAEIPIHVLKEENNAKCVIMIYVIVAPQMQILYFQICQILLALLCLCHLILIVKMATNFFIQLIIRDIMETFLDVIYVKSIIKTFLEEDMLVFNANTMFARAAGLANLKHF